VTKRRGTYHLSGSAGKFLAHLIINHPTTSQTHPTPPLSPPRSNRECDLETEQDKGVADCIGTDAGLAWIPASICVLINSCRRQSRSRHRLVRTAKEAPDIKGDTRATTYTQSSIILGKPSPSPTKQSRATSYPCLYSRKGHQCFPTPPSTVQCLHLHPPFPPQNRHTPVTPTPPSIRPGLFSALVAAAASAAPPSSSEKQSTSLSLGPPPLPWWCPYTSLQATKRRSARRLHSPLPLQQVKARRGQARPGRQTKRTLSPSFLRSLAG
jgi:hypothetical protein